MTPIHKGTRRHKDRGRVLNRANVLIRLNQGNVRGLRKECIIEGIDFFYYFVRKMYLNDTPNLFNMYFL